MRGSVNAGCRQLGEARGNAGFTLIELLVTITIATILITLAIPSYTTTTSLYRVSTEANGLVGDLQYARSEAIKQGITVTLCASTDGASCNGTSWSAGRIVISNPGSLVPGSSLANTTGACSASIGCPTLLRVTAAFSGSDVVNVSGISGTTSVSFSRDGFAGTPAGVWNSFSALSPYVMLTVHPTTPAYGDSCVVVSGIGKVTLLSYGTSSTTAASSSVTCS